MQTNIAKHEKQRTRGDRSIISLDYSMPYATKVLLASHAYTQQNARHTSAALCLSTYKHSLEGCRCVILGVLIIALSKVGPLG